MEKVILKIKYNQRGVREREREREAKNEHVRSWHIIIIIIIIGRDVETNFVGTEIKNLNKK